MLRLFSLIAVTLLSACANPPSAEPARHATDEPVAVVVDAATSTLKQRVAAAHRPSELEKDGAPASGNHDFLGAKNQETLRFDAAAAVRARLARVLETETSVPLVPAEGAPRTLMVRADVVGFEDGQYVRDSLALAVVVQTRWSDDTRARSFAYRSSERAAGAWTEAVVTAELNAAYRELGERIAQELFMEAPLAPAAGGACGLKWVAPERLYRPQVGAAPWEWNRFIVLDTRTPTLAWESLGEYARRAGSDGVAQSAREVRYDLRLWQALPGAAPLLVYERQGLSATLHTLEMRLRADTKYYWSVRARFIAPDGSTRATTWGRFRLPYAAVSRLQVSVADGAAGAGLVRDPCDLDFMAESNYYRFATPAK